MPKRKRTHTTADSEGDRRTQEKGGDSDVETSDKATPEPRQTDLTPESPFVRSSSKYPNKFYTIGWICALSVELGAAKGMLDEAHGEPQTQPKSDPNLYTLGRIHDLSVVIACLPLDEYGTSSAANLVGQMWNTFPNLRVGLFVGIGAAIPCFHEDPIRDIRLGDVVVGTRVVDYEMRKQYAGGVVKNTGQQDRPSRVLRSSLQALRAAYETKSSKITHHIKTMVRNNPEARHFAYQESLTDQLCAPCLVGGNCNGGRNVTKSQRRSSRPDKEARIHYGVIASGNTLCRDRDFREKARKEFDAICFDMEAAGVMNNFEGLVVRGISDYADCHKNDDWHSYAAASAAGYAKLLLCYVPANVKYAGTIENVTKNPHHGAEEIEILDWISQETLESRHVDHLNRLQSGTGEWFLSSAEFKNFVDGDNPLLFCSGMPGAGKTMISTLAIDTLRRHFDQDTTVAVCFLYFDYRIKYGSTAELVAIVLRQVAAQRAPLSKSARSLFEKYNPRKSRPPLRDYISTLQSTLLEWKKVLLVVDAIDECPSSNGTRQVFLDSLDTIQANSNLIIMATARPNPDIVDVMKSRRARRVEIRARDEDVKAYITGRIRQSSGLARQKRTLRRRIKQEITEAVDGMFLLAQLYLDRLIDLRIPRDIEDVIASLPRGYDAYEEAFSQAMIRIERQDDKSKLIAKKALSWIIYATRPLKKKELQHALALRPTDTTFHKNGMPTVDYILSACVGLVVLDKEGGIVRLVHYTAQQYFEGSSAKWFPGANVATAKTCLQYLSLEVFDARPGEADTKFYRRHQTYHLYSYAVRNLAYHVGGALSQLDNELMQFLTHDGRMNAYANELWWPPFRGLDVSPCHIAAALDVDETLGRLLDNGYDINASDGTRRTPLVWAAQYGCAKATRRLLKEGHINVNAQKPGDDCPIHRAVMRGNKQVFDLLIGDPRVDVDARDRMGKTLLMLACEVDSEDIAAALLTDSRVNPNAVDNDSFSALHHACENGNTTIIDLLMRSPAGGVNQSTPVMGPPQVNYVQSESERKLRRDIELDIMDSFGYTPLHAAAMQGKVEAMKMLLDTGKVAVDRRCKSGRTPLSSAAQRGYVAAVSLLLERGARADQADIYGQLPLHLAAGRNREGVVRKLLQEPKGDCLALDKLSRSVLLVAAEEGAVSIVRILLAQQQRDEEDGDPDEQQLLAQTLNNEQAPILHLIRSGEINLTAKDHNECLACWAIEKGHLEIAKAVLDTGVSADHIGRFKRALLSMTALNGNIEMAGLLLSRGADPALCTHRNQSPLYWAVRAGHYDMTKLFLHQSAAAAIPNKVELLATAADHQDGRLLKLLVGYGLDPTLVDSAGNTPLDYAVHVGSVRAVKRLLRAGASRDLVGDAALGSAKYGGWKKIVRLLQAE